MNIPLGKWSGSDATDHLRTTIESFNKKAEEQSRSMVGMSKAMLILAIVQAVGLIVQIAMTMR